MIDVIHLYDHNWGTDGVNIMYIYFPNISEIVMDMALIVILTLLSEWPYFVASISVGDFDGALGF